MNKKAIDTKVFKVLSYVTILWLIGLMSPYRNEKDVKFHIKQGIILTIFIIIFACIILLINNLVINHVFVDRILQGANDFSAYSLNETGRLIKTLLNSLIFIVYVIFSLIGITNVLRGRDKFLPLIGKFPLINKFL